MFYELSIICQELSDAESICHSLTAKYPDLLFTPLENFNKHEKLFGIIAVVSSEDGSAMYSVTGYYSSVLKQIKDIINEYRI